MDGSDWLYPDDYYVRVYDDRLMYRKHCVNGYKTEEASVLIYTIHKLSTKVVVQLLDSGLQVTYIGRHKGTFKMPSTTDLGEILKVALSSALDKPVTVESKFSATLFRLPVERVISNQK